MGARPTAWRCGGRRQSLQEGVGRSSRPKCFERRSGRPAVACSRFWLGTCEGRGQPSHFVGVRGEAGHLGAGGVRLDPQGLLLPGVAALLGRGVRGWRKVFAGRGSRDEFEGFVSALGKRAPKIVCRQGGWWTLNGRRPPSSGSWAGGQHGAHGDMPFIVVDHKGCRRSTRLRRNMKALRGCARPMVPGPKAEAQVGGAIGIHRGTNQTMSRSDRRPGPAGKPR